jgi:Fungal chitosanase of glycosyl hydrolase group 75
MAADRPRTETEVLPCRPIGVSVRAAGSTPIKIAVSPFRHLRLRQSALNCSSSGGSCGGQVAVLLGRSLAAGVAAMILCGCPVSFNPTPTPTPTPFPTTTPTPTPLPEAFIPSTKMETAKLFNGLEIHSRVSTVEGPPAIVGRKTPDAYLLDLEVKIQVPKPADTLEKLQAADPNVEAALPGLKERLATAKVSNFYHALYQLKVDVVNRQLVRLDQILSRHNFFDCNTILEIKDPNTNRKALLIQSDMDVNADGSDSDRYHEVDGSYLNFQPFTSYRWPKKTDKPSQFLAMREEKLKQLSTEFGAKTTTTERKKVLKDQIDELQRGIDDLKKYSFLVSKLDPFVVLPGFMLRQTNYPYVPKLGDYVVVLFKGKLYPALLGDVGPSYKIGEASMRISSELDPRSNAYNRPSSNLDITYIVFPGSAEGPTGPPDLKKLHDRCAALLNEVGGYMGNLWMWEDLLARPSPTPTLTPAVAASVSASPSASAPASPNASPSVTAVASPHP